MSVASIPVSPAGVQQALASGIETLGMNMSLEQQQALLSYVALMQKWNRVHNLTAIRELDRMVSHHLLDSLSVAPHVHGQTVLDVGSGAGLPGIPLAVARPDLLVTMLDSNHKKTAFIQQAINELGLKNAQVISARVEDWRSPRPFDVIVSRAFSELSNFVTQTRHLLAAGGQLLGMKGQQPDAEIAGLPGEFKVKQTLRLNVPQLDAERHLIIIEAVQPA